MNETQSRLASGVAFYSYPQWAENGSRVYYLGFSSAGEATGIVAFPVAGGQPTTVIRFDDPSRPWHRFGFKVHRDRIYFTLGERESDIWIAESVRR